MSYTKTIWQDGDIITAAGMNNIENGIAGSGIAIFYTPDGTNWEVLGMDFSTAYSIMENGGVFFPVVYPSGAVSSMGFISTNNASAVYINTSEQSIDILFTSSTFPLLRWTSSGVQYVTS